jgi:hypothetical protein
VQSDFCNSAESIPIFLIKKSRELFRVAAVALTFAEPVVTHKHRPLDYSHLDRQIV